MPVSNPAAAVPQSALQSGCNPGGQAQRKKFASLRARRSECYDGKASVMTEKQSRRASRPPTRPARSARSLDCCGSAAGRSAVTCSRLRWSQDVKRSRHRAVRGTHFQYHVQGTLHVVMSTAWSSTPGRETSRRCPGPRRLGRGDERWSSWTGAGPATTRAADSHQALRP